ncbi:unnamed protein product [Auanema sp. JU1783]|nr:unnamed protein product [Auanema sp. JU1783]
MILLLVSLVFLQTTTAQIGSPAVQVKITDTPFSVSNSQQLKQIKWVRLGPTTKQAIYCVSETPVSQLRFVCTDCLEKNITDIVDVLSSASDLTRIAGFPCVMLKDVAVNVNWTGATVICQAAVNGGTVDSQPAVIDVQYLYQPHVVDSTGQSPVLITGQGYRFYVECVQGADGKCQQAERRKTLRCNVQSHPPPTSYRWLKNGQSTSVNDVQMTLGTEMIGHSIQCQANNGLYSELEMPTSPSVQIDPYSPARLIQTNFAALQSSSPFQAGNRLEINQQINLGCQVQGNPRPVVFWRLRKSNGQVVEAPCPQGFDGQYQEVSNDVGGSATRLNAVCSLRVANFSYSGTYWCSACSYVSQGSPECSPGLNIPGSSTLTIQAIGAPEVSDMPISIEQIPNSNKMVLTVRYCADPMPRPPREVVFSIDNNDLQVGQSWQNFRFETTAQNNTVPNCYLARLLVNSMTKEDQYRKISLKLQNQFGMKTINIPIDNLLGESSTLAAHLSGWWITFLVALASAVLSVCLITICVKKGLLCFSSSETEENMKYGEKKAKEDFNMNGTYFDAFDSNDFNTNENADCEVRVARSGYNVYMSREAVV